MFKARRRIGLTLVYILLSLIFLSLAVFLVPQTKINDFVDYSNTFPTTVTAVLNREIIFDCPCSAEYYARQIKALPKKELADILANDPDPLEIVCHNCGSAYKIPKSMLV